MPKQLIAKFRVDRALSPFSAAPYVNAPYKDPANTLGDSRFAALVFYSAEALLALDAAGGDHGALIGSEGAKYYLANEALVTSVTDGIELQWPLQEGTDLLPAFSVGEYSYRAEGPDLHVEHYSSISGEYNSAIEVELVVRDAGVDTPLYSFYPKKVWPDEDDDWFFIGYEGVDGQQVFGYWMLWGEAGMHFQTHPVRISTPDIVTPEFWTNFSLSYEIP